MPNYLKLIKEDAKNLNQALEYYENEYEEAKKGLRVKGNLLEESARLSSDIEYRFSQLQELEAILAYFDIKLRSIKSTLYQKLMTSSARALTSSDIKQYIDGDKSVVDVQILINDIVLLKNKFLGLSKGYETKNFMITNISKLQMAGMETVVI